MIYAFILCVFAALLLVLGLCRAAATPAPTCRHHPDARATTIADCHE